MAFHFERHAITVIAKRWNENPHNSKHHAGFKSKSFYVTSAAGFREIRGPQKFEQLDDSGRLDDFTHRESRSPPSGARACRGLS